MRQFQTIVFSKWGCCMLYLKKLSIQDGLDVFNMLHKIGFIENSFTNPVHNMSFLQFQDWLIQQNKWSKEEELPDGYVGQTIFWLYDDDTVVGLGKIRHKLTDASRKSGGNIGYAIHPQYRGKGYGNEILRLLLKEAQRMRLEEILLTVDKGNTASKLVVEKSGGLLIHENDRCWYYNIPNNESIE